MKKKVLFVDDDKDVLDGLKRTLRKMRKGWEMEFTLSGKEALEILAKSTCDVVVSDMRMPGMDGAELLTIISKKYPTIVRIVLSGHSKQESIMKSIGASHQYLAKPCDPKVLQNTVERACSLHSFLANKSLQNMITQLKTLPSLPSLYTEITEALRSEKGTLATVGEIIAKDVGMTAKILQLINSAYFGLINRVSNPVQAVNLLGLDTIKSLVLYVNIFSQIDQSKLMGIPITQLWKHSMLTGSCSRELAKLEHLAQNERDDAFMAGVLHDIGIIVLAINLPAKYNDVLGLAQKECLDLTDAEQKIFGASHSEVGGYLLGLWGFPDHIVETVFFHHRCSESRENQFGIITAVNVANTLVGNQCPCFKIGGVSLSSKIDSKQLDRIGIADHLTEWSEACNIIIKRVDTDEE